MKLVVRNGGKSRTASGPAIGPPREAQAPPRNSAPGLFWVVLAPERHMLSSLKLAHPGHIVDCGTQSATHSARLPTMSKAPRAEVQLARVPVRDRTPLAVLQSVVPLSGPGSGVPFAPTCHSALVGSRLPALAHASCAWNQVMNAEGMWDGRLSA